MTCKHNSFAAKVDVHRLSDVDDGPITGYTAEIHIKCVECGTPFRFLGLPFGSHYAEPRLSADATELLRFLGLPFGSHYAEPRLSADATELRAPIEPAYAPEILGMPLVSGRG